MAAKRLVTIAAALMLALSAIPATAKHRSHDRSEKRLARLAYELHEATDAVYAGATLRCRNRCFWQWRALSALRRLDRDAGRFRHNLVRKGPDHRKTRKAFRRLERSYARARHTYPVLRRRGGLKDALVRVERLIHRVDHRLARSDRRHPGRDPLRHPRRDAWRSGDRDGDRSADWGFRGRRWRNSWAFDF